MSILTSEYSLNCKNIESKQIRSYLINSSESISVYSRFWKELRRLHIDWTYHSRSKIHNMFHCSLFKQFHDEQIYIKLESPNNLLRHENSHDPRRRKLMQISKYQNNNDVQGMSTESSSRQKMGENMKRDPHVIKIVCFICYLSSESFN